MDNIYEDIKPQAEELAKHKEYNSLRWMSVKSNILPSAIIDYANIRSPEKYTLQLHGHQIFIKNLFSPHTKYKRLLLCHSTGTGKTVIMNSVAKVYTDYFRQMKEHTQITVIGFTEDIVVGALMTYPEFGFVSRAEVEELTRLNRAVTEREIIMRNQKRSAIKKRITTPSRGGYYKFYGYQQFANNIIQITTSGEANNITHNWIYEDDKTFEERLHSSIEKGYAQLNLPIIEAMKYGIVLCDEIHNTYNMKMKNCRGIALYYVLNYLERDDALSAPRVLYMSATPLTGSPAEIIDIMNLLVPLAEFKRDQFFDDDDLQPDALSRISDICRGYVSFLGDTQSQAYPRREIVGEEISTIPYLKFIKCPMSPIHERATIELFAQGTLASNATMLHDIVLPNPSCSVAGFRITQSVVLRRRGNAR